MIPSPQELREGTDYSFTVRIKTIMELIGKELAINYVPGTNIYDLKLSVCSQFYLGHSAWAYVERKLKENGWVVLSVDATKPCVIEMQIRAGAI